MNARRARRRWVWAGVAAVFVVGLAYSAWAFFVGERNRWLNSAPVSALAASARQYPDDHEVVFRLAFRLTALGRSEEALAHIEEAVRRAPDRPEYWFGLARAAATSGKLARSEEALLRAVELKPGMAEAHFALGELYNSAGLTVRPLQCFAAGERYAPVPDVATAARVECLVRQGKLEEGWDLLHASITRLPMQDRPMLRYGRLAEALNKRDEAEPGLRKRISAMPPYAVGIARAPLARLLALRPKGREDLEEAETLARRAIEDPSPMPEFHLALGVVLRARGDLAGAEAAARKALELDERHRDTLSFLAEVLDARGRGSAARSVRARIPADPEAAPALRAARAACDAAPDDPAPAARLVTALERAGLFGRACDVADAVLERVPGAADLRALSDRCRARAIAAIAVERVSAPAETQLFPWADE